MDATGRSWIVLLMVLTPVFSGAWRTDRSDPRDPRDQRDHRDPRDLRERRPGVHYHTKRHMLPSEPEPKKRMDRTTQKPLSKELRKKPSGHLAPLAEDDIENEEVVSVAVGPAPIRPKFEKHRKQQPIKQTKTQPENSTVINLVRDVLWQIGREFLTRELSENFVFGQYVGNSMKNLTSELCLNMQHEILDLILKYQKLNARGSNPKKDMNLAEMRDTKERIDKKFTHGNETDESWPDFSNLAKIVG